LLLPTCGRAVLMATGNGAVHEKASARGARRGCSPPITDAQKYESLLEENRVLFSQNQEQKALIDELTAELEQLKASLPEAARASDEDASKCLSPKATSCKSLGVRRSASTESRAFAVAKTEHTHSMASFSSFRDLREKGIKESPGRVHRSTIDRRERSAVHNLMLRVGAIMFPPHEIEAFAEILNREGFVGRQSLKELVDDRADELGIPRKLAAALRAEAEDKALQRRYSGKVQPVADIMPEEELVFPAKQNHGEKTLMSTHRSMHSAKDSKTQVSRQVHRIGHRMFPPWQLQKFAQQIEDLGYTTRESLSRFSDVSANRLGVPLNLAAALREKAAEELFLKSSSGKGLNSSWFSATATPRQSQRNLNPQVTVLALPSRSSAAAGHGTSQAIVVREYPVGSMSARQLSSQHMVAPAFSQHDHTPMQLSSQHMVAPAFSQHDHTPMLVAHQPNRPAVMVREVPMERGVALGHVSHISASRSGDRFS